MIATTSKDETCNIYTLRKGHYVRTLNVTGCIDRVLLSEQGHTILLHSTHSFSVFSSMNNSSYSFSNHQPILSPVTDNFDKPPRSESVGSFASTPVQSPGHLTNNHTMTVFCINGRKLATKNVECNITTIKSSGMYIISAETKNRDVLTIRNCVDLEPVQTLPLSTEITCVTTAGQNKEFILAGGVNGQMFVITSSP